MKIVFKKARTTSLSADLTILPLIRTQSGKKKGFKAAVSPENSALLDRLDKKYNGQIAAKIKYFDYLPNKENRRSFDVGPRLRLSGLGSTPSLEDWRLLGGDSLQAAKHSLAKSIQISLDSVPKKELHEVLEAVTEGLVLSNYEYTVYKSAPKPSQPIQISFCSNRLELSAGSSAIKSGRVRAEAAILARDLVNCPPTDCGPAQMVREAKKIAKSSRIQCRVFGKQALQKMKANALLGVSQGSATDPALIHLSYRPKQKKRSAKTVVLVGKGITFDSGGLSIKTGKGMEDMKCDMAGAGCVLAVMKGIAELPAKLAPEHEVHALVPTCENMVNAKSQKPGDVVKALNGKTIEILNTDAEGRLILADALSYSERLKPDVIIDLATLTGSCIAALGPDYAGLFSNDREFATELEELGRQTGELLWQLPLASEYRKRLDSRIADLKNIGSGGPGAVIAALFLKEFVPPTVIEKGSWAHLDIAGPAFISSGNNYTKPGGTGYGVRMLLRYLQAGNIVSAKADK